MQMAQQAEGRPELGKTREQIDAVKKRRRAINGRRSQLLTEIASRDEHFGALAESVAAGEQAALKRSLQLRHESADMAIEIESLDIVIKRIDAEMEQLGQAWSRG